MESDRIFLFIFLSFLLPLFSLFSFILFLVRFLLLNTMPVKGSPEGSVVKESACQCKWCKKCTSSMDQKDPLEEGMAAHFSILAWRLMDRGTWTAKVHRAAKSQTGLKWLITQACRSVIKKQVLESNLGFKSSLYYQSYDFEQVTKPLRGGLPCPLL